MKAVFVILVIVAVYLFYPSYDLYVKEDAFAEHYSLAERGIYSREKCDQAGRGHTADYYRCRKRTVWDSIMGNYSKYDPEIRDTLKSLEGEEPEEMPFQDLQ